MAIRLTESTPIQFIKGVGEARGAAFARLGIETAGDLLGFYPRAYEERGRVINITDSIDGEICSLVLTVRETSVVRQIRKGFSVFRSIAYDESGSIELVFFNMPFMARSLTSGRRFRASRQTSPRTKKSKKASRLASNDDCSRYLDPCYWNFVTYSSHVPCSDHRGGGKQLLYG